MKILISLIAFFSIHLHAKCDFKNNITKIYSLSGPVTIAFKEIGLLSHPKIKGLSTFHPISKSEFKGEILPGGIFLSRDSMRELSGSVVLYDESTELTKMLKTVDNVSGIEVRTRGLVPRDVSSLVVKTLGDHLLVGCEKELAKFLKKTDELEKSVLKNIKINGPIIFYVGEFRMGRAPELVMVNDGIVKWLVNKKMITTYPSALSYVNWSPKIMNEMPKSTLHVAIKDSGSELKKNFVKVDQNISFVYPGSLIPGMSQLEAWAELFRNL